MPANRKPAFGLLWVGLAASYLVASLLGHREAALALLGLMLGALVAASGHPFAGFVSGVVLGAAAWRFAASAFFLAYVPPLAAFAFMGFFFARTLGPGREPLIARIARKEHPDLPPDMARYARSLTVLWSACFAALFLFALGLAPFVPFETWARWVNGLGAGVPALLFLCEHAVRRIRFTQRSHGTLRVLVPNVMAVLSESAGEAGRHPATDETAP